MGDNSTTLHEPADKLSEESIDRHRAIASIMEEMEAVDWYDQRVQATSNPELKAILAHNRDEEKEHAAMGLEWLRRNDPGWDEQLREYLFTEGSIVGQEEDTNGSPALIDGGDDEAGGAAPTDVGLGIGSLKGA